MTDREINAWRSAGRDIDQRRGQCLFTFECDWFSFLELHQIGREYQARAVASHYQDDVRLIDSVVLREFSRSGYVFVGVDILDLDLVCDTCLLRLVTVLIQKPLHVTVKELFLGLS